MAVGQVVGWQPEGAGQDEPALWRIAMADGDVEDLEEGELTDALQAAQEERGAAQEVEAILACSPTCLVPCLLMKNVLSHSLRVMPCLLMTDLLTYPLTH